MRDLRGLRQVVIGTVIMALVSTLADAFWAAALPEQRAVYGLVHGGIIVGVMGWILAKLGASSRKTLAALSGLLIGVLAAALFYVLYPVIGVAAMLISWMALWLAFAFLANAVVVPAEPPRQAVLRGIGAAVFSGAGFWLISGIWLGPHDPGFLYSRNLVAWCIAFLPGFAALLLGRASGK